MYISLIASEVVDFPPKYSISSCFIYENGLLPICLSRSYWFSLLIYFLSSLSIKDIGLFLRHIFWFCFNFLSLFCTYINITLLFYKSFLLWFLLILLYIGNPLLLQRFDIHLYFHPPPITLKIFDLSRLTQLAFPPYYLTNIFWQKN